MQPLERHLTSAWPPEAWRDHTVVLAVSGGPDSMALLRAMRAVTERPERLVVAHYNHLLRGSESDGDEAFVRETCRRLGLACRTARGRVEDSQSVARDGLEGAARKARYEFLQQVVAATGARFVATAHTADDQAETILHRILRGTGIAGLAGMPRQRPLGEAQLVRPLLDCPRTDVLHYLDTIEQPYCEDATNREVYFTRNRIRRELLPQLAEQYNPAVAEALLRLGQLAGEIQQVLDAQVEALCQAVVTCEDDRVRIACGPLANQPRYLVRELFVALWRQQDWPRQAMGFAQWERLADLALSAEPGKAMFPGPVEAEKREAVLRLCRRDRG